MLQLTADAGVWLSQQPRQLLCLPCCLNYVQSLMHVLALESALNIHDGGFCSKHDFVLLQLEAHVSSL